MDKELIKKMNDIAEEIFGTATDPDQIPINDESREKLNLLTPYWLTYKLNESGEPISWVIVMPTTTALMQRFLNKEISERELFELTQPSDTYGALYLCSAITVLEYRHKGLAVFLIKEAISNFNLGENVNLFAWPTSEAGQTLVQRLEKDLGKNILIRK